MTDVRKGPPEVIVPDGIRIGMSTDSTVTQQIAQAVADREGVDVLSLPPLYEVIDPDALERLCSDERTEQVSIDFTYADYRVSIESGDETTISLESEPSSATYNTVCDFPS